jgi:hypothetical protein
MSGRRRSRRRTRLGISLLLAIVASHASIEAQGLSIEVMTGSAYNVPTPLTIRQDGFPRIRLTARYDTKPFGPFAPYYSSRFSFWRENRAWEIQHVHHRLFLDNTTPEVERFDVHYGYNYLLFGRGWRRSRFVVHVNGGAIITSPASTIRGRRFNTLDEGVVEIGYRLSGVGGGVAVSRQWDLSKYLYIVGDAALLAAAASVPVADGSASVPNISLHGHVGVGLKLPVF